jgi:hypothetical protein
MKARVRRAAVAALVAAAILPAAGCGGSSGEDADAPTALTALDLVAVVSPQPETPDGADYALDGPSAALTLADLQVRATTPRARAEAAGLARAGLLGVYTRTFVSSIASVESRAYLFRTGNGADGALATLRDATVPAAGAGAAPLSVDGLGDGAWSAHGTAGASERAAYVWRHGSLVLVTLMSCPATCTFDLAGAARDYVDELDDRARDAG